MKYINVISKQNHNVIESKLDDNIIVKENSVVLIDANLEDVQKIERQGNDLIIHFKNGEILKISDFYNENNTADNSLVFKDDEAKLSWIQHLEDAQIIDKSIYYQSIDELEPLLYEHDAGFLIGTPWLFAGGVLAAGGLIAGLSSSNSKHETSTEDNTIAQPVAPTKYINDISGEIIYLSIDKISNDDTPSFVIQNLANGQTALLYVDGVKVDAIYDKASNTLTPKIPLAEGTHEISYIIVNQQGNVSSPSDKVVITIDVTAPIEPIITTNNASGLSGSSEANALITLDLGHGTTLTTTANSQGKWSFTPNPIADGETATLTATDEAGNVGSSITTDKADQVAPLAPSVELNNASGLGGTSEANAVITLDLGHGNTLTTTANSQGKWSFAPNPIADGETATLTATDAAGNIGAETTTEKADTVAPPAPSVEQNNAAGLVGTSEANAVITLDLGNGNTLTTTANSQGKWSFAPNPIADGETGKLTATDEAGNVGAETITDKADTVAPLAPSVELNNAASLSGTSEANTLITLDLGHGTTLTTTANSR
ncbi:Ig-like domain-containing protein [Acinetobacter gerneri]|uniref:Ig-like domain-containing protein n=1 Tax=Acinetobacter gerneri TaxID=202952 RepID=UPI003AF6FD7D